MTPLDGAKRAYNEACELRDTAFDAVEALTPAIDEEKRNATLEAFDKAQADVDTAKRDLDRLEAIYEARNKTAPVEVAAPEEKRHATVGGSLKTEPVYRPDTNNSFFRDMLRAAKGDTDARQRIEENDRHMRDEYKRTFATSTDGQFLPPIYLGEHWAELPRASRPFANIVPKIPLPADGLTITVPKVTGGASEAVQSSLNASVSSTDPTVSTVTASMVTIAGQVDVARQDIERSFPGLDMVIYRDLANAYDAYLDTQLLSGSGSSGQHAGIRGVSGANTATASTTTPVSVLGQIYNASQAIATTRYRPANVVVMHPRRAAWMASPSSNTNVPLFQQGGLFQAFGTQDNTFAGTVAGLPVVLDPNIGTTYGNPGTNQDEIYVLHADDLLLAEGPVRQATFEDVGSGTLTVRLQLFGYSFFVPNRQAKSIAIISGAGLATPTF